MSASAIMRSLTTPGDRRTDARLRGFIRWQVQIFEKVGLPGRFQSYLPKGFHSPLGVKGVPSLPSNCQKVSTSGRSVRA